MKQWLLGLVIAMAIFMVVSALFPELPTYTADHRSLTTIVMLALLAFVGTVAVKVHHPKERWSIGLPFVLLGLVVIITNFTGCATQPPPEEPKTVYARPTQLPKDCDPKRVTALEELKAAKEAELATAEARLARETARVNAENEALQGDINTLQQQLNGLVQARPAQTLDGHTGAVVNKKEIDDHTNKEKKIGFQIAFKEATIASNRVPIRNLIAQRDLLVQEVEKLGKQLADELDCLAARLGERRIELNNTPGDATKAPPVVVEPPPGDGKK